MGFMKKVSPYWLWFAFAVLVRLVAATGNSRWNHPDEWFQTVEFANLILNGVGSFTSEVSLHMRNLSWPTLLGLPLGLARALGSDWVGARFYCVEIFTGLLDLGILWGFWQCLQALAREKDFPQVLKGWLPWAPALVLLPWFGPVDALRPSQEHLSAIALWLALGALCRGWYFVAGVFCVAVGAFKYPAGTFSLGFFCTMSLRWLFKRDSLRFFLRYLLGVAAGIFVFGLADWIFYGRPWESLWMYSLFNVFTDLSSRFFGAQSGTIYLDYLTGHWGGALAFVGIPVATLCLPGLWFGLKNLQPWALALIVYLLAHGSVPHKESRFIIPVEFLCVWAGIQGLIVLVSIPVMRDMAESIWRNSWFRRLINFTVGLSLLVNGAFFVRGLWGERWIAQETFFEVNRHLRENPGVCGVVSVRRPISLSLPGPSGQVPQPAFGYFPAERRSPVFPQLAIRPLIWIEAPPQCSSDLVILLHQHKPDSGWEERGCKMLSSGVLKFVPRALWTDLLDWNLVSGTWYRCPSSVLGAFSKTETRKILKHSFDRLPYLPPWRISGDSLLSFYSELKAPLNLADGTLGDW
ncbi:hypothetical protein WDW86_01285 [Bdellovibrionota bacterium FG-2]